MESCRNRNSVKQIKIFFLHFRLFKVATLCLVTALHTLGILSTSFTWNALPTVPPYAPHLLAAFPSLCGPTHPKPAQLG